MQSAPLAIMILSFSLLVSCNNHSEDSSSESGVPLVKSFEGDVGDPCFEIQMEVWMDKFHHYQLTGADMFTADMKARDASVKAYQDCQHGKSRAMVNNEARKN